MGRAFFRSVQTDVSAVLDDHALRALGDLALFVPGHAVAGQTVKRHGGELLDHLGAEVCRAHVGRSAGGFESLRVGINAVIGVRGELVGNFAVHFLVLLDEGGGALVGGVGVERGQEHNALGQGSVKALHGEDAVHAVHAEEGGLIAHGLGLAEDDGGGLIVDGEEHEVGAGVLGGGELNGEVRGGGIGEGGLGDDLESALGFGFLHEGIADALGVSVVVTIDNSDLCARHVLGDVVSRAGALVGVGEADLEDVVLILGHIGGGSGRGQHKGAVGVRLVGNGQGSAGGGAPLRELFEIHSICFLFNCLLLYHLLEYFATLIFFVGDFVY